MERIDSLTSLCGNQEKQLINLKAKMEERNQKHDRLKADFKNYRLKIGKILNSDQIDVLMHDEKPKNRRRWSNKTYTDRQ